jgi:hypothetical protein
MTILEKERLAKLEEKTDNIVHKLDVVIDKIDNLDAKFVTRAEFNVIKWIIGVLIGLTTAVSTFLLVKK